MTFTARRFSDCHCKQHAQISRQKQAHTRHPKTMLGRQSQVISTFNRDFTQMCVYSESLWVQVYNVCIWHESLSDQTAFHLHHKVFQIELFNFNGCTRCRVGYFGDIVISTLILSYFRDMTPDVCLTWCNICEGTIRFRFTHLALILLQALRYVVMAVEAPYDAGLLSSLYLTICWF